MKPIEKGGKPSITENVDETEKLKLIQEILSEEPQRTWDKIKKERYILKEKDITKFEQAKIDELLMMDNHDNISDDERELMEREGMEIKLKSDEFQYNNNPILIQIWENNYNSKYYSFSFSCSCSRHSYCRNYRYFYRKIYEKRLKT